LIGFISRNSQVTVLDSNNSQRFHIENERIMRVAWIENYPVRVRFFSLFSTRRILEGKGIRLRYFFLQNLKNRKYSVVLFYVLLRFYMVYQTNNAVVLKQTEITGLSHMLSFIIDVSSQQLIQEEVLDRKYGVPFHTQSAGNATSEHSNFQNIPGPLA
jgi:hypothetical protein